MSETKKLGNFTTRMIINVLGIPAILFLIKIGRLPFALFMGLVALLAQVEFYRLMQRKGYQPWSISGIGCGVAWIVVSYFAQELLFPLMILVFLVHMGSILFKPIENATANIAVTLFGFIYIPVMLSILVVLRETTGHLEGGQLVTIIFVTIWICDALAFVFGKWLGKKRIAPAISPGKTWAGCIGGLLGAIATVVLIDYLGWKPAYLQLKDMIVIGLIAGIFGQSGDFIESVIKRDVNVKDSSSLLMGHGGVMDRFDSFLFAPGFVYLYMFFSVWN